MLKTTCSRLRAMNLLPMRGRRLLLHGGLTSISCILCISCILFIYSYPYIYIYSNIYIYIYIIIYIYICYYIYSFIYTNEWYQIFQNVFSALEPHTGVSLLFMSRDICMGMFLCLCFIAMLSHPECCHISMIVWCLLILDLQVCNNLVDEMSPGKPTCLLIQHVIISDLPDL